MPGVDNYLLLKEFEAGDDLLPPARYAFTKQVRKESFADGLPVKEITKLESSDYG